MLTSGARGLTFGPNLPLYPFFVYVSSKGYGETGVDAFATG